MEFTPCHCLASRVRRFLKKMLARLSPYRLKPTVIELGGSQSYDFYVSTSGSGDLSTGGTTVETAWPISALDNATAQARYAGTRVGLLDGTYGLYAAAYPNIHYAEALLNVAGGSEGSPTIIEAVNPRAAILDGSENNAGLVFLNGGENAGGALIGAIGSDRGWVTFKNLVIRNHFGTAITCGYSAGDGHTVSSKISGIVIDGCEIYDINADINGEEHANNTSAVVLYHCTGATVRNCYVHDVSGGTLTQVTHVAGVTWWDVHDSVLEYCTFKVVPNGVMFKGAANARWTVRNNYFESDPLRITTNLMLDGEQSSGASYAHNNVFVNGTAISHSVAPFKAAQNHLFNNTLVDCTVSGLTHHQSSNASKWLHCYNNIHSNAGGLAGSELEFCEDSWATLNNNCYSPAAFKARTHPENDASSSNVTQYTSLASWQTRVQSSLSGAEDSSFQDDPEFTGTGADALAYQLDVGSPCIGTGVGGVDMGAWGGASPPARIGKDF